MSNSELSFNTFIPGFAMGTTRALISHPFEILKIKSQLNVKKNVPLFLMLDIIACVSPIGIFLGRLANFINGELIGKVTSVPWSVIFPAFDKLTRHPSQLYEALLEGIVLFIILNKIIFKKIYSKGTCSCLFLVFYGIFRIISEFFREPDVQLGYIFNLFSMGTFLSLFMIFAGFLIFYILRKKNENKQNIF